MKKLLAILLAIMVVFSFTACGDDTADEVGGLLEEVGEYLQSDEFDEAVDKNADLIESLMP